MNNANVELTATCTTSKETWNKLLSVYEQSSGQRVDRLMEQLFTMEKSPSEDIATHIARLQKNFHELNDELKRIAKTELPDLLLMSRIMSTLPADYFEFKSVWESVPVNERTVNLLTERLRLIEMRLPSKQNESVALVANLENKKHSKNDNNNFKSKQKCFKCRGVGHYAKDCPKHKSGSSVNCKKGTKPSGEAFLCEVEGVAESDVWIADSGASVHMTRKKDYFLTYEAFIVPKHIQVGNNKMILAYGHGIINVEMFLRGKWIKNHLENVWYVPDMVEIYFLLGKLLKKGIISELIKMVVP